MKPLDHFEAYTQLVLRNRLPLRQLFFAGALVNLLIYYFSFALIHQVDYNPLLDQEIDPTYWMAMILRLPDVFSGYGAIILDSLLFLSCIGSLLLPRQTLTVWIFFISHFLYFILYNLLSGHHYISIGLLFLSIPFLFTNKERFAAIFTFCRFLFCFMLFSAAIWKIIRGNLTHFDQGSTLLLLQFKSMLFQEDSFQARTILFFAQHKFLGQLLWIGMIIIELMFFLGFVTIKKDTWLLVGYLLFFIGGWFFFNLYFFENLLFLLTLYPVLKGINALKWKDLREKQQPNTFSNLASGLPLQNERSSSRH